MPAGADQPDRRRQYYPCFQKGADLHIPFSLERLGRSFDQRSHTYLGYALRVRGSIGSEGREFRVAVGEGAHAKHQFKAPDSVSGEALPVADPRLETVEFYKVSSLKTIRGGIEEEAQPPPWSGVPPPLAVYRERGHR